MAAFPLAVHHTLSGANTPDEPEVGPIRLAVHEAGNGGDRPPVVFCHGFPELAFSWRDQLPAVAAAPREQLPMAHHRHTVLAAAAQHRHLAGE